MRKLLLSTLLAGAACAVQPAVASTVVDGSCINVADAAGCLFDGNINDNSNPANVNSFKFAEAQYNLYNNTHPSANPDITLNYLSTIMGDSVSTSGTWDLPGYLVDFIAVKAGAQFVLYQLASPASSGSWSTAGLVNDNDQLHGLSHLVLFGSRGAVPEPATWAMMILGFGAVGAAMRRRRKVNVSYSMA